MKHRYTLHRGKTRKHASGTTRTSRDQIRQAEAIRRQNEFMALLSHELLTPLACILGWSEFAHQLGDSAKDEALTVIERNARRQRLLVDELLTLLQPNHHGKLILNPRQTGLWRLLDVPMMPAPHPEHTEQLSLALDEPELP